MKRTSQMGAQRYGLGGLPLLSAALLSVVGLCWDGAMRDANAQAYGGANNQVIVNYDVLNALPGQPAPYGATAPAGGQVRSQFLPGYAPLGAPTALPPYTPYGAAPSAYQPLPVAPGLAAGLPVAPGGMPTSAITTMGPDGRPITPIKLKKPGSGQKPKKNFAAPVAKSTPVETAEPAPIPDEPAQVAEATPPAEPMEVPADVPMPAGTPPAPEPGVNAEAPEVPAPEVQAPEVQAPETQAPEAQASEEPAAEEPAAEEATPEATESAEQPAEEAPAEEAQAEPTQEAAVAPPAEATPTEEAPAEQPAEEAAEQPAEPDITQPAPPVPEGGIRIVFPAEMNDVPPEANAALDDLAAQMLADENMRIQIMCYASGTVDTESKARRKSLARCINIRQYLFKKDVRTTRMDVRALGLKAEGQPADRVDIVPPEAP